MLGLRVPEDAATGTALAESRPVEVYQTGEGVIVLSNRPATPDGVTAEGDAPGVAAPSIGPQGASPARVETSAPQNAAGVRRALFEESDARSAALWGGVAMIVLLILAAALLARQRRLRADAHYAALLANSELRPSTPASSAKATPAPMTPAPTPPAPTTPAPMTPAPMPPAPMTPASTSSGPAAAAGDSRSASPTSGVNTPPVSERQWLSQPPPRGPKEPPS